MALVGSRLGLLCKTYCGHAASGKNRIDAHGSQRQKLTEVCPKVSLSSTIQIGHAADKHNEEASKALQPCKQSASCPAG